MAPKRVKEKLPACGFVVTLNAKDESLPVKIKKVAKGKKLSVLSGITGSRAAAVTTLKQLLGVGGEVSEEVGDGIELQGDQSGRLLTILRNLGALRGETSSSSISFTVKANTGIDTFMKQKDLVKISESFSRDANNEEMSKACILVHGRYWPYCNGACVYCPPLTDVFEGLDMYCSWFEQPAIVDKKIEEKSAEEMSEAELNEALSVLGMKAEVGPACRDYERQKRLRVSIPFVQSSSTSLVPSTPPPRVVKPKKHAVKKFQDKPVRVILNRSCSNSDYFVMEVSLRDPAQWMKDYEYFLVSLLRETNVDLANHELEDSRRLLLFFYTRVSMDECRTVLDEVMPDFFEITLTDALLPLPPPAPAEEEINIPSSEEESPTGLVDFEEMAREFGVDNGMFWEKFTLCVEDSDGSQEGLMHAFQKALLEVTK